jgi:hypothetical protein
MTKGRFYLLFTSVIISFIGMIAHINYMLVTNEFIHFVCFLLWVVVGGCLILVFDYEIKK